MPRKGENIYKREDGRWEARYIKYYADGKAKYGYIYAKSYSEVKKLKMEVINGHIQKPMKTIDTTELFTKWLERKKINVKQSTYSKYYNIIYTHIIPHFKNIKISDLNTDMIDNFIIEKKENGRKDGQGGLSNVTVCNILSVVKGVLYFAEREKYISCPTDNICKPKIISKEMRVLTIKEQETLEQHLESDLDCSKLGILICLYTGVRLGEICALKWNDIDLDNGIMKVRKTLQRITNIDKSEESKTKIIIDTPKSKKSLRDIPLPNFLIEILKSFKNSFPSNSYVISKDCIEYVEPRTYQNRFKAYLKECSIKNVNFHALRHTFATRCVELGVDIKSLSEILGHSNVSITLNKYVHSSSQQKKSQMNKLEQLYNR